MFIDCYPIHEETFLNLHNSHISNIRSSYVKCANVSACLLLLFKIVIAQAKNTCEKETTGKKKKSLKTRNCDECSVIFESRRSYLTHIEVAHTDQDWLCHMCDAHLKGNVTGKDIREKFMKSMLVF